MKVVFNIEPVAQGRPRYSRRPFMHAYDPKPTKMFKNRLNGMATKYMAEQGMKPFDGPLLVDLIFYRSIQKSVSKKEHDRRENKAVLPTVKPDVDNYIKSVLDAFNGAIWVDDNLICDLHARKFYSDHPRIELTVKNIKESDELN